MNRVRRFGDTALLVELDDALAAQALAAALATDPVPGVEAAVPGLRSVLIELRDDADDIGAVERAILARLARDVAPPPGRLRTVPVVYGGEHGPDLADVAAARGMTANEYARRHAATELRVLFCGFAAGFAYLGDLPDDLRVPRLATPRTRTPAGSVAVAGTMSGIYPAPLPGGWRIIGRTPVRVFDPWRDPPAWLAPGDRVRFVPTDSDRWPDGPIAPDEP